MFIKYKNVSIKEQMIEFYENARMRQFVPNPSHTGGHKNLVMIIP